MSKPHRLIVVSNRVSLPGSDAVGGLASALGDALEKTGGIWFGWSGRQTGHPGKLQAKKRGKVAYVTMDLSHDDYATYYAGFANRTLWPMLHYRPDLVTYEKNNLDGYLRVNHLFADNVLPLLQPDDVIWVHDYHLIPLASMLRKRGVKNRIGFFLHTPLPAAGLLIALPSHRELLETLSEYDLIGVHTARDLRALEDYFLHESGGTMHNGGRIHSAAGRVFKVGAFPISIDTERVARLAAAPEAQDAIDQLRATLGDRQLIIGAERLDYSKGLPERFDAYARLLEEEPALHGEIEYLQVAPYSRGAVKEYQQLRRTLERSAGHINGKYATPDWVPIRYVNTAVPQTRLIAYYRSARVGLVTPLRDGMNLVAKEYVAAQDPENPGVLILSQFAGAAMELDQALLVNPADTAEVTEALQRALKMSLKERRTRWKSMMHTLRERDIVAWRESFLAELQKGL